ncbi:hypothetical protein SFR_0263 [Streptomyces sp. FR-008]|nr:hypothetical protein SFR_0263 [Streptomyces sp. FR-008]
MGGGSQHGLLLRDRGVRGPGVTGRRVAVPGRTESGGTPWGEGRVAMVPWGAARWPRGRFAEPAARVRCASNEWPDRVRAEEPPEGRPTVAGRRSAELPTGTPPRSPAVGGRCRNSSVHFWVGRKPSLPAPTALRPPEKVPGPCNLPPAAGVSRARNSPHRAGERRCPGTAIHRADPGKPCRRERSSPPPPCCWPSPACWSPGRPTPPTPARRPRPRAGPPSWSPPARSCGWATATP